MLTHATRPSVAADEDLASRRAFAFGSSGHLAGSSFPVVPVTPTHTTSNDASIDAHRKARPPDSFSTSTPAGSAPPLTVPRFRFTDRLTRLTISCHGAPAAEGTRRSFVHFPTLPLSFSHSLSPSHPYHCMPSPPMPAHTLHTTAPHCLPDDVLPSILQNLDTLDLLVVATVCRPFYEAAKIHLYRKVDLTTGGEPGSGADSSDDDGDGEVGVLQHRSTPSPSPRGTKLDRADLFLNTMRGRPRYGRLVHCILVSGCKGLAALPYCTNLRALKVQDWQRDSHNCLSPTRNGTTGSCVRLDGFPVLPSLTNLKLCSVEVHHVQQILRRTPRLRNLQLVWVDLKHEEQWSTYNCQLSELQALEVATFATASKTAIHCLLRSSSQTLRHLSLNCGADEQLVSQDAAQMLPGFFTGCALPNLQTLTVARQSLCSLQDLISTVHHGRLRFLRCTEPQQDVNVQHFLQSLPPLLEEMHLYFDPCSDLVEGLVTLLQTPTWLPQLRAAPWVWRATDMDAREAERYRGRLISAMARRGIEVSEYQSSQLLAEFY